jgi:hypothetical protein
VTSRSHPRVTPAGAAAYAPLPREAWAQVHAREHVTRYLRRGTGRPLVALSDDTTTDAPWPVLAAALSASYRVLLPEIPAGVAGEAFGAWLDAFLDGTGASPVSLLAFGARCADALAFAAADAGGGRLARVVLVPGTSAHAAPLAGAAPLVVPTMIVPPVAPTDMAFGAVRRFLEGVSAAVRAG